jgi:hypothetical protein
MLSAQIFCPMRSLDLWLSAQERMNVRFRRIIKNTKQLVDVAPHWGEPRISCVFGVLCVMLCFSFICLVILLLCIMDRFDVA